MNQKYMLAAIFSSALVISSSVIAQQSPAANASQPPKYTDDSGNLKMAPSAPQTNSSIPVPNIPNKNMQGPTVPSTQLPSDSTKVPPATQQPLQVPDEKTTNVNPDEAGAEEQVPADDASSDDASSDNSSTGDSSTINAN